MSEQDFEVPEADALEQGTAVLPDDDETASALADGSDGRDDVDPADWAAQQRSVGLGEDEYR